MNKKEGNKSIKKHILLCVFIAVLLIIVSALAIRYLPVFIYHQESIWSYCADYEQYSDDFNLVKDYIATEFPNEEDKLISVSLSTDKIRRIYDPDIGKYLTLPDKVEASLDSICRNGFPNKDSDLDFISVSGERIAFCIYNGSYALVYSPYEKPRWLHSPDEKISIRVREIEDGWYHVVKYSS